MTYNKAVKPHIDSKLTDYLDAMSNSNEIQAFAALEDAHVIGQHSTYYHCLIHYKMLRHGLLNKDWRAVFGQVIRIIGAATKTAIGLVPKGNTGGTNISPFKRLPVSAKNQAILDKINHA
ncbi:MAG: DUF3703 domain-containing protein [Alteromonadaceae bacterium]|jgi:hypothetical protein|uniref:DUF3703 domain-containing protein n=1 Tax=Paraglaciecola agarilytica NO2 TaxID=1125747 RepID=A0ABQ0I525_9ALTE|nr:DUF3703 domain-containing protein [Paraglaciecola agarilytica]MBN27010.1 DUF3703 domain-containing protein [Alteromonadaceae bacterium]GAC04455.1 hypothetical protein GAGA_1599 [Paraglaciecola agarilytica NO2]|tara:strand:+ start:36962 stop:37321 length:360 start_codon:yes stop_codon:yes gene_type:complete